MSVREDIWTHCRFVYVFRIRESRDLMGEHQSVSSWINLEVMPQSLAGMNTYIGKDEDIHLVLPN